MRGDAWVASRGQDVAGSLRGERAGRGGWLWGRLGAVCAKDFDAEVPAARLGRIADARHVALAVVFFNGLGGQGAVVALAAVLNTNVSIGHGIGTDCHGDELGTNLLCHGSAGAVERDLIREDTVALWDIVLVASSLLHDLAYAELRGCDARARENEKRLHYRRCYERTTLRISAAPLRTTPPFDEKNIGAGAKNTVWNWMLDGARACPSGRRYFPYWALSAPSKSISDEFLHPSDPRMEASACQVSQNDVSQ